MTCNAVTHYKRKGLRILVIVIYRYCHQYLTGCCYVLRAGSTIRSSLKATFVLVPVVMNDSNSFDTTSKQGTMKAESMWSMISSRFARQFPQSFQSTFDSLAWREQNASRLLLTWCQLDILAVFSPVEASAVANTKCKFVGAGAYQQNQELLKNSTR